MTDHTIVPQALERRPAKKLVWNEYGGARERTTMAKHHLFYLLLSPAVCACAADVLNAGSNDVGDGGYPTYHWAGEPSHSFGIPCDPLPEAYTGTFVGEFETHTFSSGSRALTINIEGTRKTLLCGTLVFGRGEPTPIPVDPEADYAPGLPGDAGYYKNSVANRFEPVEGFVYEFGRGAGSDQEYPYPEIPPPDLGYSLQLNLAQPYKAWCNLQTSYDISPVDAKVSKFTCLPFEPYGWGKQGCSRQFSNGREVNETISCTQATLCYESRVCECGTWGCTVKPYDTGTGPDFTLNGDTITGTMELDEDPGIDNPLAFRLTRIR